MVFGFLLDSRFLMMVRLMISHRLSLIGIQYVTYSHSVLSLSLLISKSVLDSDRDSTDSIYTDRDEKVN